MQLYHLKTKTNYATLYIVSLQEVVSNFSETKHTLKC